MTFLMVGPFMRQHISTQLRLVGKEDRPTFISCMYCYSQVPLMLAVISRPRAKTLLLLGGRGGGRGGSGQGFEHGDTQIEERRRYTGAHLYKVT